MREYGERGMSSLVKKLKRKVKRSKREFEIARGAREKKVYRSNGGTITVRPEAWVIRGSEAYEEVFRREQSDSFKTNIKKKKMYSLVSQAKDWFLELQLRSEKYKFNNMLAVVNPFGEAPLTALVLFTTLMDYSVRVTVEGDTEDTSFISEYPPAKRHRIPILGLYPGRSTNVVIELLDENGQVCDNRRFPLTTEPLPEDLKDIISVKKKNDKAAFKNILIAGGIDIKPCVFDKEGQIRYYLRRKPKGYGIFPLSKGRFLFMEREISAPSFTNPHSVQMYDMDYLGRVGRTYLVKNGAHHTVEEKTPGGNILTAGNSLEEHSEDLILELNRENGEIVHQIKLGDLFDETYQDMMDWAHINSASYDKEQDSMLVSMRNIHSVASFDWSRDEIRWLFADPRFWEGTEMADKLLKPVGEVPWFYQQHAVFEVELEEKKPDIKHIMVFDNHWHKRRKVKFFDKDKLSYISFYEINEKEKTVKLYKRFPCPKSKIRSNAIFDKETRHLYAMAGFLVPEIEENLGLIREYDFDSMEVLSEYYVKPGFFRAHEFLPDMVSLSKTLVKNTDYLGGDLKRPQRLTEDEVESLDFQEAPGVKDSSVFYRMQEDLLYIHEMDHAIGAVYLRGNEGVWKVDFSDTWQTMKTFEDADYRIAMWLDQLPLDQYELYILLHGELQNTGKKLTKQK